MMRLFDAGKRRAKALIIAALLVCSYVAVYEPQAALAATSSDNFARGRRTAGPQLDGHDRRWVDDRVGRRCRR